MSAAVRALEPEFGFGVPLTGADFAPHTMHWCCQGPGSLAVGGHRAAHRALEARPSWPPSSRSSSRASGNDAAAHVTVGDLMALCNERAAARIGGAL